MQNYCIKFICVMVGLFIHTALFSQKYKSGDMIGCWAVKRFEFLQSRNDSMNIINSSKGYIICFEANGKFVTKQKTGNGEKVIGDGTYNMEADGKTLNQKRNGADEGEDEPAEIVRLTDRELAMKVDGMVMHLEKVSH